MIDVKIIVEKPPMWDEIVAAFNVVPVNAIFSYGDCIYNPQGVELQDYLIKHEMTHFKQQGGTREGAAIWWGKFLRDPKFRAEQEIECYGVQFYEMCKLTGDRNKHAKILWDLASSLSGPLYDNCISHVEAMRRIKEAKEIYGKMQS